MIEVKKATVEHVQGRLRDVYLATVREAVGYCHAADIRNKRLDTWGIHPDEILYRRVGDSIELSVVETSIMPGVIVEPVIYGKIKEQYGVKYVGECHMEDFAEVSFGGYWTYLLAYLIDQGEIFAPGMGCICPGIYETFCWEGDFEVYRKYLQAKYPQIYFPSLEGWQKDDGPRNIFADFTEVLFELHFQRCAYFGFVK